jgi:hypothetical protein
MRKCVNVEIRKCGNVEMWKCGNAEMRKCVNFLTQRYAISRPQWSRIFLAPMSTIPFPTPAGSHIYFERKSRRLNVTGSKPYKPTIRVSAKQGRSDQNLNQARASELNRSEAPLNRSKATFNRSAATLNRSAATLNRRSPKPKPHFQRINR